MTQDDRVPALAVAFNRAIVEHFGAGDRPDAEEVMIAAVTVAGAYIAGVGDPVARGALLASAQWMLGRMVAEVVRSDAAKGRGRRGT